MKALVINLADSTARWESAARQLTAAGFVPERIDAFDGRGRPVKTLPGVDAAGAVALMGRPLRGGEVGCYLSHRAAAQAVVDSGARMALVVEDDAALTPEGGQVLHAAMEWLAARGGWDLVNAGANRHKLATRLAPLPGGAWLLRAHYFPMMASALIWSRAGAHAFVAQPLRIDMPVDNHFRRWLTRTGTGLTIWPAPVSTTGAPSDIDDGAAAKRSREGRHPLYGWRKQRRLWGDKAIAARHLLAARWSGATLPGAPD